MKGIVLEEDEGNDYSEDRIPIRSEDLDEVIFYQDKADTIYFIPTSMVNKVIIIDDEEIQVREYHNGEEADYYLYRCTFCKTEWGREIYLEQITHPLRPMRIITEYMQRE